MDLPNLKPFKKSVLDAFERKNKEKELWKLKNKDNNDMDFENAANKG